MKHIYGVWFVPSADDTKDWMGTLTRDEGKWWFEYRFRYYNPNSTSPHDGKDEKSWYKWASKTDSDEDRDNMIEAVKSIVSLTEKEFGEKHDLVLLDCAYNDPKVLFELGSRPWTHFKVLSEEEAKEHEDPS